MNIKLSLVALLLAGVALSGCAESGDGEQTDDVIDENTKDLVATADTGIIRGVVISHTIQPIAGVTVSVLGTELQAVTDADGVFGMDGITPGVYFLSAEKPGWNTTQASASVVANEPKPPVVKIQMAQDPDSLPFFIDLQWDGFIACSFSLVAVGFAACNTVAALDDDFIKEYRQGEHFPRRMDFAQSEMLWESTQAGGDRMSFYYSGPGPGTLLDNYAGAKGVSSLLINSNITNFEKYSVPDGYPLQIRVFNAPIEGTDPGETVGDPRDGDNCIERPQLGGCTTGVGATIDQRFTVYTHAFFGFLPDDGWAFTQDGHPVVPSE